MSVIGGSNQRMGEGLLEADTAADDPAYGLPVHHPLSSEYLDFSWNKLLLLLFSWALARLYAGITCPKPGRHLQSLCCGRWG